MENNQEISQVASEISTRIKNLESLMEVPLAEEMLALKQALIENPAACALLEPEDIGILVTNVKRTLSVAVLEANTKPEKSKKAAKVSFTPEQMAQALLDEM